MQGIFIGSRRPKSKKEVREVANAAPGRLVVEATSMFGNEFDGRATDMTVGQRITFVGPDPHTSRRFYGTLERTSDGFKVS